MRCVRLVVLFCVFGIACAYAQNGEEKFGPTMEKMEITMLNVALIKDDSTEYEIFSGEETINVLAANPGQVISQLVNNVSVPSGNYTSVRVTVSRLAKMKMYLDIPEVGRVMQTTATGVEMAFPEGPTSNNLLDPNDYAEFTFLQPEGGGGPDQNMDPSELEAAPGGATPTSVGSMAKSSPEGVFNLVVEDGKTTTFSMNFPEGSGEGMDQEGKGNLENPVGASEYEVGSPS